MSRERNEADRVWTRQIEITCGGLAGIGVIAIVQMLSVQSLDTALKVSLYGFAISIPLLAAIFLAMMQETKFDATSEGPLGGFLQLLMFIGNFASFTGMSGLFFHFTRYAGIVFVVASVAGFVFVVIYMNALQEFDRTP